MLKINGLSLTWWVTEIIGLTLFILTIIYDIYILT